MDKKNYDYTAAKRNAAMRQRKKAQGLVAISGWVLKADLSTIDKLKQKARTALTP